MESPPRTAQNTNTLVLTQSMEPSPASICFETLPTAAPEDQRLAFVAHSNSVDAVIEGYLQHAGSFPAALEIVDVGGTMRSTASQSGSMTVRPGVTVHTVAPDDLTGLGIRLSEFLADRTEATQSAICFDSLTTLLQYSDLEAAYQFLHVITGRIHATESAGCFHLDPSAHDEQTVETMKSLFDVAVDRR